ncbi:MFS transporter [Clostridium carboxidivorans P7]|uniref:Major facilitator superfamily MFS_1 n=1 Tax=Clostridium carboxidivorans P7 TaxID=536227 RepID=C6PN18_9CLOT|nr:MFS transporter [Clostridium carboxidivorans]AKN30876.1 MFS transporter [Clostridium carboxidivorans P7]EET89351.1 major facilitator superfamily MFS_1 [Clostridium carboxidivorans P7]EFG88876.1 transporter, major facilitator family protein [Clostridium carboxidivorans P7]
MNNFISKNIDDTKSYSLITLILFWSGLVIMSSLYVTIPLVSTFSQIFSVEVSKAVWSSSGFSLCFAIGCLCHGPLSDRYGRKKVIIIGLSALTIISFLLGTVHNLVTLITLRGIQGAAAATFSPVALSYAVELFPPKKRVVAIGFISTGFLMAGIIGQVFSSFVNQHIGWNFVFYILGLIYLITTLLIILFIPNLPISQPDTNISKVFKQMKNVFKIKSLKYAYIIALVLLLSFVGMYSALGNFLSSPKFNFTTQQILYVRLIGIIGMVLSPYAGKLVEKFSIISVLRGSLLLSIIGLALIGISRSALFMIIMSVIFVIGIAITTPTLISLIGVLGGKTRGSAVSMYTFILFLGASIGPVLTMRLLKTGSYTITFTSLAACLVIGILATFFINLEKND